MNALECQFELRRGVEADRLVARVLKFDRLRAHAAQLGYGGVFLGGGGRKEGQGDGRLHGGFHSRFVGRLRDGGSGDSSCGHALAKPSKFCQDRFGRGWN